MEKPVLQSSDMTHKVPRPGLCTSSPSRLIQRRGRGPAVSSLQLGGHQKNKEEWEKPTYEFPENIRIYITLEVQLMCLKRSTAFCHLKCTRKPLLAIVPPHSEGQRLLQSPVLYLHKAHKICLRFTRTQENQLCGQLEFSHSSLQDLWYCSWHTLTNYFFLFYT